MLGAFTEISSVAAAVAILLVLMVLGDIVDLAPALLGCIGRGKENINLFNNVKMRRSRNRILMACFPAAYLILAYYPFHPLLAGRDMGMQFLLSAAIIGAYLLMRLMCLPLFFTKVVKYKDFKCGMQVFYTFCVAAILVMFGEFGICRIFGMEDAGVAALLKWTLTGFYCLFLVREYQVFSAHRGYLTAFLYLCGLEILPTGLLVASYFVF